VHDSRVREILRSDQRVRVYVHGDAVAESAEAWVVRESGSPPRYYLPFEDVRVEALQPHTVATHCPWKGDASYWDVVTDTGRVPVAAWTYRDPLPDGEPLRDLVCFFQERPEIQVEVDGAPAEAPATRWSTTDWVESARARA
jgi:uncharacterized protein (DUF427 family)